MSEIAAAVSAASSPAKGSADDLLEQFKQKVEAADADAAASLLADLKAAVKACDAVVQQKRQVASKAALGDARYAAEASCVQPRGKLSLRIGADRLAAVDKAGAVKYDAPLAAVAAVLVLPPVEARRPREPAFVLCAAAAPPAPVDAPTTKQMVDYYKKCALAVTVNDKHAAATPLGDASSVEGAPAGGTLGEGLARVLAAAAGAPVVSLLTGGGGFKSPATGLPYVAANLGASQGHLALCAHGLAFLKPLVFLPSAKVAAISCGRAGSATCGSFDLVVEMESPWGASAPAEGAKPVKPATFEFSGIPKDELPGLQAFVRDVLLPARAARLREAQAPDEPAAAESDESDEDDVDFEPTKRARSGSGSGSESLGSGSGSDDDDSDSDDDDSSLEGSQNDARDAAAPAAGEETESDADESFGCLEDPAVEAPAAKKRRAA